MPRARTGHIVNRNGKLYARITYMGTDGKRHAVWRAARNRTHGKQLLVEIAHLLGTEPLAQHKRARQKRGFVYALRMDAPVSEKPIKIGFSVDVDMRIDSLSCGSPYPVTLLGFWETGNGDLEEREIHKQFADHRLKGEWFRPSNSLLTLIESRVTAYRERLADRAQKLATCES